MRQLLAIEGFLPKVTHCGFLSRLGEESLTWFLHERPGQDCYITRGRKKTVKVRLHNKVPDNRGVTVQGGKWNCDWDLGCGWLQLCTELLDLAGLHVTKDFFKGLPKKAFEVLSPVLHRNPSQCKTKKKSLCHALGLPGKSFMVQRPSLCRCPHKNPLHHGKSPFFLCCWGSLGSLVQQQKNCLCIVLLGQGGAGLLVAKGFLV